MNTTNFSFSCPHCQKTITSQDFTQNHFTIAHLQDYFQQKEQEYKEQLFNQITQNPNSIPLLADLKAENERLKLLVEGYKLGSTKGSKEKGEELEKYILEQLQASYNGNDEISKITHVGEKADISQEIYTNSSFFFDEKGTQIWTEQQQIAKIIYEIKNAEKWENKWLEKLEKDMVNEKAEFGIIIATCRKGNPLWKPFPNKNLLVSDEDNFLFASQMARLLCLTKQRLGSEESAELRIQKWEAWIKDKLPNYLLNLEKYLGEWEKDITRISTSVKNMLDSKEKIQKTLLENLSYELGKL